MNYYLWILLFGALLITKAQDLSLFDALPDEDDPQPTEPPKPAGGGDLDLADAIPSDPKQPVVPPNSGDPKQPVVPPKTEDPKQPVVPPNSGGGFSDDDLLDGKKPDASHVDYSDDAQNDQPKELHQQLQKVLMLLGDNLPEGLLAWIANSKQVIVTLLEKLMELLDLNEAEKQS
ncbi:CD99 molecule isoform X3 [Tachysurus fulvidraco]|uniref:CD99 molecule isoform X3 n=1 Tax=Tachysurus fulvidraco TaxID=1234273 RepID=UPI001FF01251|nr:CD99 molecule isoform X3 [Tachysurus fulvidraco]